jgi:hypothetical protein
MTAKQPGEFGPHLMNRRQEDRGRLIQIGEAADRGQMSVSHLRRLLLDGKGPRAFKRPWSNRWLFWTNEFDAWLESGRVNTPLAGDPTPTSGQTPPSKRASGSSQGA